MSSTYEKRATFLPHATAVYHTLPFTEQGALSSAELAERLELSPNKVASVLHELRAHGWVRWTMKSTTMVWYALEHRAVRPQETRIKRGKSAGNGSAKRSAPTPVIEDIIVTLLSIGSDINDVIHKLRSLEQEGSEMEALREQVREMARKIGV